MEYIKNALEESNMEPVVWQRAVLRVDTDKISTNVPRVSPSVKPMHQQTDATPMIPEKELISK